VSEIWCYNKEKEILQRIEDLSDLKDARGCSQIITEIGWRSETSTIPMIYREYCRLESASARCINCKSFNEERSETNKSRQRRGMYSTKNGPSTKKYCFLLVILAYFLIMGRTFI
jgi:hypothetical protein